MENYEEKYKEALSRAKYYLTNVGVSKNEEPIDVAKKLSEYIFPELAESEDEQFRKYILKCCEETIIVDDKGLELSMATTKRLKTWLEKQKSISMIQWKGNNLKEIVDFTGKSLNFDKWFKSWDEYEQYVHSHNNILKLFCEDGSHYEVPVGAWIVKTPDGYNVSSQSRFMQKPKQEWSEEDEQLNILSCKFLDDAKHIDYSVPHKEDIDKCIHWLKSFRHQKTTEKELEIIRGESYKQGKKDGLKEALETVKETQWNPSEEQMNALYLAKSLFIKDKDKVNVQLIREIIEQLKAL